MQSFAASHVNNVWIRNGNRDRADRRGRLIVKDRLPGPAEIGRFKNAAVHRRHVKNIRLRRNTRDRARPPAAVRADISPPQDRIKLSRLRVIDSNKDYERDRAISLRPKLFHEANASLLTTYGILVGSPP